MSRMNRGYQMLVELGVKPSVTYLRIFPIL